MLPNRFRFAEAGDYSERACYQNATADWAVSRLERSDQRGVLLCDPVGNGKTWEATLTLINYCDRRPRGLDRVMVVAGKSELSRKWFKELQAREVFDGIRNASGARLPALFARLEPVTLSRQADDGYATDGKGHRANLADPERRFLVLVRSRWELELLIRRKTLGIWIISPYILMQMMKSEPEGSPAAMTLPVEFVVYDECHHARKRSENATYRAFMGLKRLNPECRVVGLTATPAGASHNVDTVNLIETICFPVKNEEGTEAGLPQELEEISKQIGIWCGEESPERPAAGVWLQTRLTRFICRTPNRRKRHYYVTGARAHRVEGISNLPIPSPFDTVQRFGTSGRKGVESLWSQEPIDIEDLSYLAAIHATLGLDETDRRSHGAYTFLTAGDESLQRLLQTQRSELGNWLRREWLKKKDTHPKTERLLKFTKHHFSAEKGTELSTTDEPQHDRRGKLLIFCAVKSVVKSPYWRFPRGSKIRLRQILKQQLEKYLSSKGKAGFRGEVPRRLGKGASSAAFTRTLRILLSDWPPYNQSDFRFTPLSIEELCEEIAKKTPDEIFRLMTSSTHALSYNDGCIAHLDHVRDCILAEIFFRKSRELTAEQEMKYLILARDYLWREQHQGALHAWNDPWFGLTEWQDELSSPKLSRDKGIFIPLYGLFYANHALVFETYRLYRNSSFQGKDPSARRELFFSILWRLVLGAKEVLEKSESGRWKRSIYGRENPLTHPVSPLVSVTGDTHVGLARTKMIELFNLPLNPAVLFCTEVGTEGIDLHRLCWDVVHYTLDWVPSGVEQKIGRIDRERGFPALLRAAYERDPRFEDEEKRDTIRVHFVILPHTYDERVLFRVNRRASDERSLFAKDLDFEFKGKDNEKRESLDLRPRQRKPSRKSGTRRSSGRGRRAA